MSIQIKILIGIVLILINTVCIIELVNSVLDDTLGLW